MGIRSRNTNKGVVILHYILTGAILGVIIGIAILSVLIKNQKKD